jgi:hypothetical protein
LFPIFGNLNPGSGLDPDPDRYWIRIQIGIQLKMLDPDPDSMNDPKHCFTAGLMVSARKNVSTVFFHDKGTVIDGFQNKFFVPLPQVLHLINSCVFIKWK